MVEFWSDCRSFPGRTRGGLGCEVGEVVAQVVEVGIAPSSLLKRKRTAVAAASTPAGVVVQEDVGNVRYQSIGLRRAFAAAL